MCGMHYLLHTSVILNIKMLTLIRAVFFAPCAAICVNIIGIKKIHVIKAIKWVSALPGSFTRKGKEIASDVESEE